MTIFKPGAVRRCLTTKVFKFSHDGRRAGRAHCVIWEDEQEEALVLQDINSMVNILSTSSSNVRLPGILHITRRNEYSVPIKLILRMGQVGSACLVVMSFGPNWCNCDLNQKSIGENSVITCVRRPDLAVFAGETTNRQTLLLRS